MPITVAVAANDVDPDGDALTVSLVSGPTAGTATAASDGTVTYVPAPDANGSDSFVYQVCDPSAACASATVSLTVAAVNDRPSAWPDDITVAKQATTLVPARSNDVDVDGDPLTITVVSPPDRGVAWVDGAGDLQYDSDDRRGGHSFVYRVCDPSGLCSTSTVLAWVADDTQPEPQHDYVASPDGGPVVVDVVANDRDLDGDLDASTVTTSDPGSSEGTATVLPDGSIQFTPDPGFSGVSKFKYRVCDAAGDCTEAEIFVTVRQAATAPVAVDDAMLVTAGGSSTMSLVANDTDDDTDLRDATVSLVSGPAVGAVTIDSSGIATFVAPADFTGSVTFTYRVIDSMGAGSEATVTVTLG